jgi:alpha-N-arabinofuranosidase
LKNIEGSDNRFFNNLFIGQAGPAPAKADPQWGGNYGTWMYDFRKYPVIARGNVYYQNARPSTNDAQPTLVADLQTGLELVDGAKGLVLRMNPGTAWREARTGLVTTEILGKARVPQLPYVLPDGAPLKLNTDFFGKRRSAKQPVPGPFERLGNGMTSIRLN